MPCVMAFASPSSVYPGRAPPALTPSRACLSASGVSGGTRSPLLRSLSTVAMTPRAPKKSRRQASLDSLQAHANMIRMSVRAILIEIAPLPLLWRERIDPCRGRRPHHTTHHHEQADGNTDSGHSEQSTSHDAGPIGRRQREWDRVGRRQRRDVPLPSEQRPRRTGASTSQRLRFQ